MNIKADPQLEDAILNLQQVMKPIYDEWCSMQLSAPLSFEQYLIQDILAMGHALSGADGKIQKLEINVIAEMLAALPHTYKSMPYAAQLPIFDKQIADYVALHNSQDSSPALLTKKILSEWMKKGAGSDQAVAEAVQSWVMLANRIILRDGYIDNQEVSMLDKFEKSLMPV